MRRRPTEAGGNSALGHKEGPVRRLAGRLQDDGRPSTGINSLSLARTVAGWVGHPGNNTPPPPRAPGRRTSLMRVPLASRSESPRTRTSAEPEPGARVSVTPFATTGEAADSPSGYTQERTAQTAGLPLASCPGYCSRYSRRSVRRTRRTVLEELQHQGTPRWCSPGQERQPLPHSCSTPPRRTRPQPRENA
jgi:hypothetical protein